METTDPIAELNAVFNTLGAMIRKLAVAEDADHRTAGRSKKALELCKSRLGEFTTNVDKQAEQVNTLLERIASELAAITNGVAPPTKVHTAAQNGKIVDVVDNIRPARSSAAPRDSEWVTQVKKGKKSVVAVPASPSLVRAPDTPREDAQIVPGYHRQCISISHRDECMRYPGRFCVIAGSGLIVYSVEDYVLPFWVPELQPDGQKPYKVIDHVEPETVVDPSRSAFHIDPTRNPASTDTGNFLALTHIRPISIAKLGGTQYCVRVGGNGTIVQDIAMCSPEQLAFAERFYLSGTAAAVMIIDARRKIHRR